jgi:hypothetical protein
MNCGIIFWGNSLHSINIFIQQEREKELSPGQDLEPFRENYLKILMVWCTYYPADGKGSFAAQSYSTSFSRS